MSQGNGVRFLGVVAQTQLAQALIRQLSRDGQFVDLVEVALEPAGSRDAEPAGRVLSEIAEVMQDPRRDGDEGPRSQADGLILQKEIELTLKDGEQFLMGVVQVGAGSSKPRLGRELADE